MPVADELARAAGEENVGRALREYDQASVAAGLAVDRAHELSLGRERHLDQPRQSRIELARLEAGLARRNEQRALGGIALHEPAPVTLANRRVACAIGDGERTLELSAVRAVDRASVHARRLT